MTLTVTLQMEEKECEEFEGFQPGDLSFSGGDFKQDWYVETGCDGSGTSQNRDAR